jgi:hypothetical protein
MLLSELKQQRQQEQQQQHFGGPQELGTIRTLEAYPKPIEALYRGEPVTLLATGDIVGMSPAEKIVTQDGRLDWASSADITVIQRDVLPLSDQQRNRFQQARQVAA